VKVLPRKDTLVLRFKLGVAAVNENLVELVRKAGVIGAGGAGFPTHVKLDARVDTVIVNGAECEPLLQVDQQLLATRTADLADAARRVMKATGAEKAVFAVKEKYANATRALRTYAQPEQGLELFLLGNFYPAGDEQVLVYEVTGRVVPEGGLPLDVGVVVCNVETLLNIHGAIQRQPVVDTYVTVTGAVNKPATLRLPVGTSIAEAIELAGGAIPADYAIVDGGPMMGIVGASPAQPLTKTSKGIIVLPADHQLVTSRQADLTLILRRALAACCQCRLCTDLCPRYLIGHSLEPHRVLNAVNYGLAADSDAITTAFLCCDCGLCELYSCPMNLSPRRMYTEIKRQFQEAGVKNLHHAVPDGVRVQREGRRVPTERLTSRIGLEPWSDVKAPLASETLGVTRVRIPLRQHIGAAAVPVVKTGQEVNRGDLIADIPAGSLGARVHASISGWVKDISDESIVIERTRSEE